MPEGMLGTLSLSDVRGPMADLEDRLAGRDGLVWLQGLKRFLRKEPTWGWFHTWKTVRVETVGHSATVLSALSKAGMTSVDCWRIATSGTSVASDVRFGRAKVKDLGFRQRASWEEILEAIKSRGCQPCNVNDAPFLRLAYPEQPRKEVVYVADDPYQDDHEEMDILVLENGSNGLILTSRGAKLKKTFLGPEEEVIFRIE